MRPLFGTVEYFEQKIDAYLTNKKLKNKEKHIKEIVSKLEKEIRHDFICHERIRKECLNNLFKVSKRTAAMQ
ncbi:hypothetical protein ABE67_23015 [Cytobacillus firmus]|uniref:hypothetical protein n=1 Tax=Cytobacillus firmus TaxID=1399 RepID=UPI0018CE3A9A|nr:hypothetical protein [Cytobacillus firmus]MBG9452150.1 hypothetical protein [Cytobacillus firmus]